jgi:hypothetical protein
LSPQDAALRIAAQTGLVDRIAPRATRILDASADPVTTRSLADIALDEALLGH